MTTTQAQQSTDLIDVLSGEHREVERLFAKLEARFGSSAAGVEDTAREVVTRLVPRRAYIPKPDGRQRPLGIAAQEDKILQRAVVEVLNAIYEVDFRGFSPGFRPGRTHTRRLMAVRCCPLLVAASMSKGRPWS